MYNLTITILWGRIRVEEAGEHFQGYRKEQAQEQEAALFYLWCNLYHMPHP